jgi:hypothetical protein
MYTSPGTSGRDAVHGLSPDAKTTEIAFVDPTIDDLETLLRAIRPGVEAIVFGCGGSALAQIAAALEKRSGIAAVHIIAHGQPGEVSFDSGPLSLETLPRYAADLARIGRALGDRGDIRLWACRTGSTDRGNAFLDALTRAAGARVAASTGLIGSATHGGSWELDAHRETNPPQAPITLTAAGTAAYAGVLKATSWKKNGSSANGTWNNSNTANWSNGIPGAGVMSLCRR